MAITLESPLAVKQQALSWEGLSPAAQMQLKALFMYLSQHKRNIQLDFLSFTNLTSDTILANAACKLYFVYAKKQNTATAATFKLNDHATTCGGAAGADMTHAVELNAANQEAFVAYFNGLAEASGITVASETNGAGGTDSTSGDGPNGFVIIGAP